MAADELNKYGLGQVVWFIGECSEPVVKRAKIVEKHLYQDERGQAHTPDI